MVAVRSGERCGRFDVPRMFERVNRNEAPVQRFSNTIVEHGFTG